MDPLFWFVAIIAMIQSLQLSHHHQIISINKRIATEPVTRLPMQSITPVAERTGDLMVHFKGAAHDALAEIPADTPEPVVVGTREDYNMGQVAAAVFYRTALSSAFVASALVVLHIYYFDNSRQQTLREGDSYTEILTKKSMTPQDGEGKEKIVPLKPANTTLTEKNATPTKNKETLTEEMRSLTTKNKFLTDKMKTLINGKVQLVPENKTWFGKYTTLENQYACLDKMAAGLRDQFRRMNQNLENFWSTTQNQEKEHARTCDVHAAELLKKDKEIAALWKLVQGQLCQKDEEIENFLQTIQKKENECERCFNLLVKKNKQIAELKKSAPKGNVDDPSSWDALRRKDQRIAKLRMLVEGRNGMANGQMEDLLKKDEIFHELKQKQSGLLDDIKHLKKALQERDDHISALEILNEELANEATETKEEYDKLAIKYCLCRVRLRHERQTNEALIRANTLTRAMLLSLGISEPFDTPSQDRGDDGDAGPPSDADNSPTQSEDEGSNDGRKKSKSPNETGGDDDDAAPTCGSSSSASSNESDAPSKEPNAKPPSDTEPACACDSIKRN